MDRFNLREVLSLLDEYGSEDTFSDSENVASDTKHESDDTYITNTDVDADNKEMYTVHVYDTDMLPSSFVEEMENTGHILNIDNIRDIEPDINNNNKCSSSTEVAGVITTACNKETANQIDRFEGDKYNYIDHDTDVLNSRESKSDTINNFDADLNVDTNNNEMVTIHLYDANAFPSSFVEEMEKDGRIIEIDSSVDEKVNIIHDDKYRSGTAEVDPTTDTGTHNDSIEIVDNDTNEDNLDVLIEVTPNRSRKRIKDQSNWQKEIRKRRRQAGKEYVSSRGKRIGKKTIKIQKDCKGHCRYKCLQIFNSDDIVQQHTEFWSLNDNQKYIYYAETTERVTKLSHKDNSRRKYTFLYFFKKHEEKFRVCKEFYFGVLGIDDSRVRNYYSKLDKGGGTQYRDMRGRLTKQLTSEHDKNFVINHILSFNRVPSHYCRSQSKKEYLESGLSVAKMYEMYTEKCSENNMKPVKLSMYRKIFRTEFNISFHIPKKDRCDICEKMNIDKDDTKDESFREKFEDHITDKKSTKCERDMDRHRKDNTTAVICFDLENVITLPRADVKNFFYKRKLNTFNLTAHCSIDRSIYNALWVEAEAGRGANEIASALICILHEIKHKHPNIKSYILWSDSCVPQNRNSAMTFALKRFMIDHDIQTITQKFCCPGHSQIQEVDNAHSSIEKVLKVKEVYSPVSLVRALKCVRRKSPFKIIQMHKHNFYDYQKEIIGLKFGSIPYTKVKCLRYDKENHFDVQFKISFTDTEFKTGIVVGKMMTRKSMPCTVLPIPRQLKKIPIISPEKKKDLTSMLEYMSLVDRQYYKAMKLCVEGTAKSEYGTPKKRQSMR